MLRGFLHLSRQTPKQYLKSNSARFIPKKLPVHFSTGMLPFDAILLEPLNTSFIIIIIVIIIFQLIQSWAIVDSFRFLTYRGPFKNFPWFLLHVGLQVISIFGNLLQGVLFTCCHKLNALQTGGIEKALTLTQTTQFLSPLITITIKRRCEIPLACSKSILLSSLQIQESR